MEIRSVLRDAIRVFRRDTGFAAVIVVTLGLGIGANSAIFSVVNGVLIRPLPYANGDRLVRIRQGPLGPNGAPGNLSPLELADVRERAEALVGVVEYHTMFFNLIERDYEPERVQVGVVSWDFFQRIGVPPLHGRVFVPEEDRIDAEPVLLLGHAYWNRRFGGDPDVVGRVVEMNNRPHRIVGVLPPVPTYPNLNDVWMPWYACPFRSADSWNLNRQARSLLTVGRLAPGATMDRAATELGRIAVDLRAEFGDAYPGVVEVGASVVPLKEELTAGARPTFLILLGMSGLVLLIACANVANLTLARLNRRQQALAVQAALGAGQGRILRQLLSESVALSLAGAVLAAGMAYGSVGLLSEWASGLSPRFNEIRVDGWVLAYTALVAVATGVLVGGLPAIQARRIAATLREDKGSGSIGKRRIRNSLVVAQVAVAFVLLAGSGLMIRSFRNLVAVDPGYEAEGVLTLTVDLDWARYVTTEDGHQFYRSLLERVRAHPEVQVAAAASDFPMSGSTFQTRLPTVGEGLGDGGGDPPRMNTRFVTDDYFEVLRVPLLRGRTLARTDDAQAEPVAILSRSASERLFEGADAVGRRVSQDGGTTWATVIGVMGDVRQAGFDAEVSEEVYVPMEQAGGARRLLVRSSADPSAIARLLTEDVYAVDANQPVSFIQTLSDAESDRLASPRTITALLGAFGLVALVTAAGGILSVIAFSTSQRKREIGIRLALGGKRREVVLMVMNEGMILIVTGLLLGGVVVFLLGDLMRGFLFGLEPGDPLTLAMVAVALLASGGLATLVPAWRGTRVNPVEAFRTE